LLAETSGIQFTKQALHSVMVNFTILSFKSVSIANTQECKGCTNMFKLIHNIPLQEFVTNYTNFTQVTRFHCKYQGNRSLNIFTQNLYSNTEESQILTHLRKSFYRSSFTNTMKRFFISVLASTYFNYTGHANIICDFMALQSFLI